MGAPSAPERGQVIMAATDKITVNIAGHGAYQTTVYALDALIGEYLPASVSELRRKIAEKAGEGCEGHYDDDATLTSGAGIGEPRYCDGSCDAWYADLTTVTECLMILAELRGHATN